MSSTPQEEWDNWYRQTHKGTDLPSWELGDDDTGIDELEVDEFGT